MLADGRGAASFKDPILAAVPLAELLELLLVRLLRFLRLARAALAAFILAFLSAICFFFFLNQGETESDLELWGLCFFVNFDDI